jgi:hypothetical protein
MSRWILGVVVALVFFTPSGASIEAQQCERSQQCYTHNYSEWRTPGGCYMCRQRLCIITLPDCSEEAIAYEPWCQPCYYEV